MYTDPDGLIVDSVWDGISLGTGVISLVADIKAGNTKAAVIDTLGIVADGIALALPFVPGGASTAIKAARATATAADIVAGAMTVSDGIENGSGLEVASGALQVLGGLSSATGLVSRCSKEAKAKNFYNKSGMDSLDAKDHMKGIDFNKDVKVKTLKKGTKVDQWQGKGKAQGNYYTKPGTSPDTLGIDSSGRVKSEYILNKDTDVLQSIAADTSKNKSIENPSIKGKGGGTQYYCSEKQNFSLVGN